MCQQLGPLVLSSRSSTSRAAASAGRPAGACNDCITAVKPSRCAFATSGSVSRVRTVARSFSGVQSCCRKVRAPGRGREQIYHGDVGHADHAAGQGAGDRVDAVGDRHRHAGQGELQRRGAGFCQGGAGGWRRRRALRRCRQSPKALRARLRRFSIRGAARPGRPGRPAPGWGNPASARRPCGRRRVAGGALRCGGCPGISTRMGASGAMSWRGAKAGGVAGVGAGLQHRGGRRSGRGRRGAREGFLEREQA